jgi:hypothetical protein
MFVKFTSDMITSLLVIAGILMAGVAGSAPAHAHSLINCYRQKQSLVAVAALYMLHAAKCSRFSSTSELFHQRVAH